MRPQGLCKKGRKMNKKVAAEAIEEFRQMFVKTSDAIWFAKSEHEADYWRSLKNTYTEEIAYKYEITVDDLVSAWATWIVRVGK
jgi:leucyl aminopeptidase (aminopeptidase T)